MNPKSLGHLRKLLLPNPRSHWNATGPTSKTHQRTLENTQQETTQTPAARVKPVKPVSQTGQTDFARGENVCHLKLVRHLCHTGQTGFARLSQNLTHKNGETFFPKPVTLVSPRELKLKLPKLK
jgi:hypothetical protein